VLNLSASDAGKCYYFRAIVTDCNGEPFNKYYKLAVSGDAETTTSETNVAIVNKRPLYKNKINKIEVEKSKVDEEITISFLKDKSTENAEIEFIGATTTKGSEF
jgi:hypothetical protein